MTTVGNGPQTELSSLGLLVPRPTHGAAVQALQLYPGRVIRGAGSFHAAQKHEMEKRIWEAESFSSTLAHI